MKKISTHLLMAAMALLLMVSCDKDDKETSSKNIDEKIEELSMNEKWISYLVAATLELNDDCESLWSEWQKTGGFAETMKSAGPANSVYRSQSAAIEEIIQGCIDIAGEVGAQKIGGPNALAKAGDKNAVLEVESWYSWNSITDYSDNIVSIRNSYLGGRGATTTQPNSISSFIKGVDADVDANVIAAINEAHTAILTMQFPFRNNLTGARVDAAIEACANLEDVLIFEVLPLLDNSSYDFTETLKNYTDNIVIPTYTDMKNASKALYNACVALQNAPTNQQKLDDACEAWKANRIPWEQSEAFLFGPADFAGLDPSLDSWPLDQDDIYEILNDDRLTSIEQIVGAITSETVRGFHTIELLLFKNGENRKVR